MQLIWIEPARKGLAIGLAWLFALAIPSAGQDDERPPSGSDADVTVATLLKEMADLDGLSRSPQPSYRMHRFSSFARRGEKSPFLRVEKRGSRRERVLAEMKGPGAIVRLWVDRPLGEIRVYLDGSALPAIHTESSIVFAGDFTLFAPPFSGVTGGGAFVRFPVPFQSGVKITCDQEGFDYQVDLRAYPKKTEVETFVMKPAAGAVFEAMASVQALRSAMSAPKSIGEGGKSTILGQPSAIVDVEPGKSVEVWKLETKKPLAISSLTLEEVVRFIEPAVLARLDVKIEFDGTETVHATLADLFGGNLEFAELRCLPVSQESHLGGAIQRRICRFVMPFRRSVRVTLVNHGGQPVTGVRFRIATTPYAWNERSLYFHAETHRIPAGKPKADVAVQAKGGVFVAEVLSMTSLESTPVRGWLKVGPDASIDAEGTSTLEARYGSTPKFDRSYASIFERACVRKDDPVGARRTFAAYRFLDRVPFEKGLGFREGIGTGEASAEPARLTLISYRRR